MTNQVPTAAKLKELNRELGLRQRFYPDRVTKGALSQQEMNYRIEVLQAIIADYQKIEQRERLL
jgi:hypothetical protein